MLVLKRKKDEWIQIQHGADTIKIYLTDLDSGSAKIGIVAKQSYKILRSELLTL